mmetsp:Transcript_109353/g.316070  ORF Transcript_109353/g.316070 Transcript_109353/m.316070 type:complete len:202 (-) Transcript_109353:179-784(-)
MIGRAMRVASFLAHVGLVAECFPTYRLTIPNGKSVMPNGTAWPGVGHSTSAGGGPRNAFGEAFMAAGGEWTKKLCEADSDGDGQSNGLELGDPHCEWVLTETPFRTADISHPGFSDSMTAAIADIGAGPDFNDSMTSAAANISDAPAGGSGVGGGGVDAAEGDRNADVGKDAAGRCVPSVCAMVFVATLAMRSASSCGARS